jgi:hypothetical protein
MDAAGDIVNFPFQGSPFHSVDGIHDLKAAPGEDILI